MRMQNRIIFAHSNVASTVCYFNCVDQQLWV